jgi:hypothetical protein
MKLTTTFRQLTTYLKLIEEELIIKKMVSVEFNRFINYYKKTRDISNQSSGSERRDDRDGAQEKIIMVVQQDIL